MRRLLGGVAMAALSLVALSFGLPGAPLAPSSATPAFTAHGSVNQVYTYGHAVGATVTLLDGNSAVVATGTTDAQGAYLFKNVPKGTGYQVQDGGTTVSGLTVTDPDDDPPDSFYATNAANNPLGAGFGYITTRDGTTLGVNVTYPQDAGTGPWPVVVDYSGYDPSEPGDPPAEAAVYPYQGYVTVGVNVRGTDCSGGAFDFMEPLESTDGYDVIETLAHEPFSNGNVGMVGISYPGFTQLFVAATQPPHLRAISPLSPFDDTYSGILYPGGILNNGFALGWATDRANGAKPSASAWVRQRIANGDTTCAQNQVMKLQARDLLAYLTPTQFNDPQYSYLDLRTFVHKITVPVYLASQWQDEQTGGSAAELLPYFAPTTKVFANFTNGTHVEGEAPSELEQTMNFIDLYVGQRIPHTAGKLILGAPEQLAALFGETDTSNFQFPFNTWNLYSTYQDALTAWEAQPEVRIRWENGGVSGKEGLPMATAESRYSAWPIPGTIAESHYLEPDGQLGDTAPTVPDTDARASSSYTYDPTSKLAHSFNGSSDAAWTRHPAVTWNPLKEGDSLSFVTPAYTTETAYAGTGSVDLWLASSAADTDLEATLTEVRPDGKEMYIQSGWLRASHRKLDDAASTALLPQQTNLAGDAQDIPAGQFVPVRLALFPFAHVVRPGSRLRLNIEAPGGNQDFWAFSDLPGTATNRIGHSAGMPSKVVLPRLPSVPGVPATLPACTLDGVTSQAVSLRNQPCRDYLPARIPTAVTATPSGGDLDVSWTAPPGATPDGYRITPTKVPGGYDSGAAPDPIVTTGPTTDVTFPSVPPDEPLQFTVEALYGATYAPASDASLPAAAISLAAPSPASAVARRGAASVTWTAPTPVDGAAPVTGYEVTPYDGATALATQTFDGSTTSALVSGLTNGTAYTFKVDAVNVSGHGPTATTAAVTPTAVRPFADPTAFVTRQLHDFTGAAPSAQVTAGVAAIDGGQSAEDYIVGLRHGTDATSFVDPVARLYIAYFLRNPDPSGLQHWVAARRAGTSLNSISSAFAGSAEFKNRYGTLSNKAFVNLVYQNVLGRAGDAGGVTYWTAQLDGHHKTRGQVMTGFSESTEFKNKSRNRVDIAVLYVDMLGAAPSQPVTDAAVTRIVGGTPLSTIVGELLDSSSYATRIA